MVNQDDHELFVGIIDFKDLKLNENFFEFKDLDDIQENLEAFALKNPDFNQVLAQIEF